MKMGFAASQNGARLLTDASDSGAKLLTDIVKLLSLCLLTPVVVGEHTLGFAGQKRPFVTKNQAKKAEQQAVQASGLPIVRRAGLVEMAAIQILSQPIHVDHLRDGLARGTIKALPTPNGAWPLLLTRDQLCEYLQVSWSTLSRICPVTSVELGVNVVRYSRLQIDDWIASLPARVRREGIGTTTTTTVDESIDDSVLDPRLAALEMARAWAGRRG